MTILKLSDVTEFVRNGASIKQIKTNNEGYPITRIETISNDCFNYDKMGHASIFDDKYSDYYLKDGDVLLSHINSEKFLGRSVIYVNHGDGPIIHGMNLLNIRFKTGAYNPKFFEWYTKTSLAKQYFRENTKHAVNQASIASSAIKGMPIPNVPIEEQNVIVFKLSKIQEAIKAKSEEALSLDELIKSHFTSLFGNPLLNDKGFKIEPLSEVCPFNSYKGNVEAVEGKYWILNLDMVEANTGMVIKKKYQNLDEIGNSTIKFDAECVLYSKLRPYLNKVVVPDTSGYGTSEFICLKTGKKINKQFLASLLRSDSFVSYINAKTAGAKMPRVSMDHLRNFPLIIPEIKKQEEFASFINLIDKTKSILQQQIKDLQELLDKKMDEYFNS